LRPRLEDAIIFAITLENGRISVFKEIDANVAISNRIFYQFQDNNLLWEIRDHMQAFILKNAQTKKTYHLRN
jgi:hypothetical protein